MAGGRRLSADLRPGERGGREGIERGGKEGRREGGKEGTGEMGVGEEEGDGRERGEEGGE